RAEAAAELALGRKLVAARELSVVQRALDVRDDVMVDAWSAYGRQHGATLRRKEREVKRGRRRPLSVARLVRAQYGEFGHERRGRGAESPQTAHTRHRTGARTAVGDRPR